jgi:hypothetical protein
VAPPAATGDVIGSGIASLDAVLPGGGIPCGRLTEVAGRDGSGATSITRAIVATALADKRWVAYVDATRTLAPGDWASLAAQGRLWIVRPPSDGHGTWCADILLRSGAFSLVVLDDPAPIPRGVIVRLTRLAREGNIAFLVLHHQDHHAGLVGSAVRLHLTREPAAATTGPGTSVAWRRLETRLRRAAANERKQAQLPAASPSSTAFTCTCTVTKGGSSPHSIEVTCAIDVARRLCPDSAFPDRRGVATRNRLGERAAPDAPGVRRATPAPDGVGGTALPRKRRCAEPAVSRDAFLLADSAGPDGRWLTIRAAPAPSAKATRRPAD